MPALFNLHLVLGPRTIPASLHLVELMAKHCRIDIWSMVPSLVDELGESPDVLSKLKSSKFICASGGKLCDFCGSTLLTTSQVQSVQSALARSMKSFES